MTGVEVRRSADRLRTRTEWLDSRHSFSFGRHYQPDNTGFGLLVVNNDDVVAPGSGFAGHPHRDMEILTWVIDGELAHQDDRGHTGVITPGLAQRMSAGTGMLHAELNASTEHPVRFVQMWVLPDTDGLTPSYAQKDINPDLVRGGLVPVASGRNPDAAIPISQVGATLWAARLGAGGRVAVPDAPAVHLFLATGSGHLQGAAALARGDAVRLTAAGSRVLVAAEPSELLVWEMHP